ncbi:tetratricopeptide repeat protein [Agromyces sp. ZXT2-3]|uniref:tetratricopeptide repeat protein n=1 Tax=Agromyces sp. ZXT2-3 TaxID=3461152 RepID=UPI004054A8FD
MEPNQLVAGMTPEARQDLLTGVMTESADNGDADSMYQLGLLKESLSQSDEAIDWHQRAREHGHEGASFRLGILYGGRGDANRAIQFYLESAEAGSRDAMYNLGNQYVNIGDHHEAARWYTRAAEAGDADAAVKMAGECLQRGQVDESLRWFGLAKAGGAHEAAAVHQVLTSATAGDANSMATLGDMMRAANNEEQAASWYRRAADAGHGPAAFALGAIIGTDALIQWLSEARQTGNPAARYVLREIQGG